jgi:FkbM family methyltransferase
LACWTKYEGLSRCLGRFHAVRVWWQHAYLPAGRLISAKVLKLNHALALRARSSDIEVLVKVFSYTEYSLPLQKVPCSILDGGANVGYAAIFFATEFPQATIVAVEPDAGNFEVLKRNVLPYTNIILVEAALWSNDGTIELEDPGMEAHAFRVAGLTDQATKKIRTVPSISITNVQKKYGLNGFDLVKLDIEGAEKEVLVGDWHTTCQVLIVELHDRFVAGCSRRFYQAIGSYDGDYLFGENTIAFKRGWLPDRLIERGYWS